MFLKSHGTKTFENIANIKAKVTITIHSLSISICTKKMRPIFESGRALFKKYFLTPYFCGLHSRAASNIERPLMARVR